MQPTSSSYDSAKCSGLREARRQELGHEREAGRREALHVGDAAAVQAVADRRRASNGSVSHGWPSTGTTSVCPDSTMPPVVALPSRAGSVANRFALRRSSSKVSVAGDAEALEVVAHPVDQREVGVAARGVEADERADELRASELGARGRRHVAVGAQSVGPGRSSRLPWGAGRGSSIALRGMLARAVPGRGTARRRGCHPASGRRSCADVTPDEAIPMRSPLDRRHGRLSRAWARRCRSRASTLPLDRIKLPDGFRDRARRARCLLRAR